MILKYRLYVVALSITSILMLNGCAGNKPATEPGAAATAKTQAALEKIKTIVVIYAENRSFDNLYGLFPGANGIANALAQPDSYLQLDRDGKTVLAHLPPVWTSNDPNWAFVGHLPNRPFQIDAPPGGTPSANGIKLSSPDLVHQFYIHQLQLNGGRNNQFAAFSNAGGLTMGYYDGSSMAMWQLAKQYTLADNFFMGAFGGSFLNHFWLACACTPTMQNPPPERVAVVDQHSGLPAFENGSALKTAAKFSGDFYFTPTDKVNSLSYAVNAVQPPFQPSGTKPAVQGDPALADPHASGAAKVLDAQTEKTVGDTLSARQIDWAWYAGAWNAAVADGMQTPDKPRKVIYSHAPGSPNFQAHHQPFNYFRRFNPSTAEGRAQRATHLKDYSDLQQDIAAGTLPAVVFYKPQGSLNQHPGYADVMTGDAHIAEVVRQLQANPQWPNMFIIVTYDENGGFWDHVPPPKADHWGPGSRIPAIFISPFVKKHSIDHTQYDTTSIIKFITRRFGLEPLPGVRKSMGDLTEALEVH